MDRLTCLSAIAGAIVVLPAAQASGAGTTDVLVRSGDASPDGNGTFGRLLVPFLNDAGQVALQGFYMSGDSVGSDDRAIIRADTSGLQLMARTGQALAGGGLLGSRFAHSWNNAGQVAFLTNLTGTEETYDINMGVFRSDGSGLLEYARTGDAMPDGGGNISSWSLEGPTINNAGLVAFVAYSKESSESSSRAGLLQGNDGAPGLVVRGGDPAPGGEGWFYNFANIDTIDIGQTVFRATLVGGDNQTTPIFIANDDGITRIFQGGDPIPGGSGTYKYWLGHTHSDSGSVAFRARYVRADAQQTEGIFLYHDGAAKSIAIDGQSIAGKAWSLATGGISLSQPIISSAGDIVFSSGYRDAEGAYSDGIFRSDGESISTIVVREQDLPDANGRLDSLQYTLPVLNSSGQIAFRANFAETAGGDTDNNGILFFDDRLGLLLVARTADAVGSSRIKSLWFGADATRGSERSGFNESGQVAYQYTLDDGTEGIALWTPPDPIDGDANLDGVVSLADFLILRSNFGRAGDDVYFQDADFNDDDVVSLADFLLLRQNFGNASDGDVAAMDAWLGTVPEPATASLLALGGLFLRRRR